MFWVLIAVLLIVALAFLVPSLLSKDVEEDDTREQNIAIAKEQLEELELRYKNNDIDKKNYESVKAELEHALFNDLQESDLEQSDRPLVDANQQLTKNLFKSIDTWLILLLVPVIALPVYLNLGDLNFTKAFDSKQAAATAPQATIPVKSDGTPDLEKITEKLKLEMESNPTDPKGWYMLGRAYMMTNRIPDAVGSFEKSLVIRPDSTETMLSLADALSMNNEGQLKGRPRTLVKKALMLEPQNVTALWLSGMAASQEGEYPEAIAQWEKVLPFVESRPEDKKSLSGLIAEAKRRLGSEDQSKIQAQKVEATKKAEPSYDTSSNNGKGIKVFISISDLFKERVSPEDLVFVYAKAVSGPPMPLAAARKQVKDFPLEIVLNDELAMMPALKLSAFSEFIVGARISKSGQPVASDSDLYTEKTAVSHGDSISIEIDQVFKK